MVTVPLFTDVGIPFATESVDIPLLSSTDEDVSVVELARVRVTEATILFGIVVVLIPQTRHVAVPTPLLQERDLFAAPAPAAKVADVKSVVE
jgi:hypothetical protein